MSHAMPSDVVLQASAVSVGIVTAAFVVSFLLFSQWRTSSVPYPPGPRPDPIIGNVRQVMVDRVEQQFAKWGKQYGDIIYLWILNQQIIVLNTFEVAKDLLERRSAIYSSRPRLVLHSELMGWGNTLVYMAMSQRWRKQRRLVQEQLIPRALVKYCPLQRQEVYMTLSHIGGSPDHVFDHLKRYAAGVILNVAYGYTVRSHDDEFVTVADKATTASVSVLPGAMLVDFFPILKYYPTWMPFSGFKHHALHTRALVHRLFSGPHQHLKMQIANGTASHCVGTDLMDILNSQTGLEDPGDRLTDADVRDLTGVVCAAATDTTNAVLCSFLLLMVLHPDVSKKVQAEIDEKIGTDRLVEFDDKASLSYYNCVCKEMLRWSCPVPLGVPHKLTEEDEYHGYLIPENATVFANIWAITRDETLYPEPERFMPDRFVDRMDSKAAAQVEAVYGFGRRACPGKWLAEGNFWLLMVNVLAMFSIEKSLDSSGRPITPPGDYTPGFIRHPKKFPCKISYRSEKAKSIVEQANLLQN